MTELKTIPEWPDSLYRALVCSDCNLTHNSFKCLEKDAAFFLTPDKTCMINATIYVLAACLGNYYLCQHPTSDTWVMFTAHTISQFEDGEQESFVTVCEEKRLTAMFTRHLCQTERRKNIMPATNSDECSDANNNTICYL